MTALVGDVFGAVLLAGFVVVAAVVVTGVAAHVRLHHPLANRRFMARYRAEQLGAGRITVAAPVCPARPGVRSPIPAGADGAPRPRLPVPGGDGTPNE